MSRAVFSSTTNPDTTAVNNASSSSPSPPVTPRANYLPLTTWTAAMSTSNGAGTSANVPSAQGIHQPLLTDSEVTLGPGSSVSYQAFQDTGSGRNSPRTPRRAAAANQNAGTRAFSHDETLYQTLQPASDDTDTEGLVSDGSVRRRGRAHSLQILVSSDSLDNANDDSVVEPIFGIAPYPEMRSDRLHADEVHAKPGAPGVETFKDYRNRWRYFGNLFYAVFFGWWIALVYIMLAAIMACTVVGLPYARLCLNFAWYLLWPFGRFIEGLPADNLNMQYSDSVVYTLNGQSWRSSFGGIVARVLWLVFYCTLAVPCHLVICGINGFLVGFIPITKVHFFVAKYLVTRPLQVRCRKEGLMRNDLLLCTYKAFAKHYFFRDFDGVNICFVNLLPVVFFCIFDGYVIKNVLPDSAIASPFVLFFLSLVSVIPLVYYVGMGVACVSAQSSFGVAAVVNATFGSIVEIILYIVALMADKGVIVVGSIVGSLVGTLLFLPGLAMIAGGVSEKEQRFNARAAAVSTTLLLISLVTCFLPSLFYKVYGNYALICEDDGGHNGPASTNGTAPAIDYRFCHYSLMGPNDDPFYKSSILPLIYVTTLALPVTYFVGLWFSLRTHADRIYQKQSKGAPRTRSSSRVDRTMSYTKIEPLPTDNRHESPEKPKPHRDYTDGVYQDEDEEAIRPLENDANDHHGSGTTAAAEGHGHGHGAPPWTRKKAMIILILSTVIFGLLAEILVQSVDVVIAGTSITEKFLGVTLFSLVPSATEYVNAILFAMRKNIELSMEISSQYTVQVTMLQVPVLVVFSLINSQFLTGPITIDNSFLLLFNSFDILAVTISFVLLSYMYTDGRTDYLKGFVMSTVFVLFMVAYWFEPHAEF